MKNQNNTTEIREYFTNLGYSIDETEKFIFMFNAWENKLEELPSFELDPVLEKRNKDRIHELLQRRKERESR